MLKPPGIFTQAKVSAHRVLAKYKGKWLLGMWTPGKHPFSQVLIYHQQQDRLTFYAP